MIFTEKPQNFAPRFDVVSCFIEHDGEILLLLRQDGKSEGNKWGMPAGKIDAGEDPSVAMVREIREETGYVLYPTQLTYFKPIYIKYPEYDYVYHIFHAKVNQKVAVINRKEHKDFKWISPEMAPDTTLVKDLDACIKLFYS